MHLESFLAWSLFFLRFFVERLVIFPGFPPPSEIEKVLLTRENSVFSLKLGFVWALFW